MRMRSLIGGVIVATICLAIGSQAVAESELYFVDSFTQTIQRANLDGSNVEVLTDRLFPEPDTIAIDVAGEKIYWTDIRSEILRANLDGSEVETLVSELDTPGDIALDVTGGKMYWVADTEEKTVIGLQIRTIQRANLDGSGVETLPAEFTDLQAMELDVAGGKIYVTATLFPAGGAVIQRTNLDGSGIEDLLPLGLDSPAQDLALDLAGGKMYWTFNARSPRMIQRANLDGTGIETLVTFESSAGADVIAVDPAGGKIYWTFDGLSVSFGDALIQRADLDGSGIEDVLTVVAPRGLALALEDLGGGGGGTPGGDGEGSDITWDVTGVNVDLVVCKNKTTGQKGRIDVDVPSSGSCGDLGLVWDSGDNVQVKVVGFLEGSFQEAGGRVTGIDANLLVCKNRSSLLGIKERIENPPPDWDWGDASVPGLRDDRIQWKAKGLAN